MKIMAVVLWAVALTFASSQASHVQALTAESAIRAADQAWAKAIASKSLEKTLSFYDAEAITTGSAIPLAKGLPELRKMWVQMFAQLEFTSPPWKLEKVVVTDSGTIGYSSGIWTDGNGKAHPYLTVWRKQASGQWKVLIDGLWY